MRCAAASSAAWSALPRPVVPTTTATCAAVAASSVAGRAEAEEKSITAWAFSSRNAAAEIGLARSNARASVIASSASANAQSRRPIRPSAP